MGRGDRRSRRGKVWNGSFGNRRPKKSKKRVRKIKNAQA
ncbi:MAG: 30S ribosomal protein THX [Candidatus Kapabacteria bacterium]|nr:30S ribosomal protein THX [Candidatus Kapabacteria bacterium]